MLEEDLGRLLESDDGEAASPPVDLVDFDLSLGIVPEEKPLPVWGLDLCLTGLVATCLALIAERFCKFVASFSGEMGAALMGDLAATMALEAAILVAPLPPPPFRLLNASPSLTSLNS